jgi:molecular chaperone GrpE
MMGKKKKTKVKRTDGSSSAQAVDTQRAESSASNGGGHESAGVHADEPIRSESETDRLRCELADAEDRLLRATAEQQNMRKRFAQERIDAVRFANSGFAKDLLPMLDDFERTLDHRESVDPQSILDGVRLIHDNLLKVLADHEVKVIQPSTEPFDPHCHEAMMQQPSDEHEAGTVLQVVQPGYRMGDRVLRPAKVIIAAAADNSSGNYSSHASDDVPAASTGQSIEE